MHAANNVRKYVYCFSFDGNLRQTDVKHIIADCQVHHTLRIFNIICRVLFNTAVNVNFLLLIPGKYKIHVILIHMILIYVMLTDMIPTHVIPIHLTVIHLIQIHIMLIHNMI